jgi:hypothetical protein
VAWHVLALAALASGGVGGDNGRPSSPAHVIAD